MAEWARQGGLAVGVATFEDWDAAGRAFDAVIAGQRWVEPIAGAAKAAAVLRLAGRLAVFRNDPGSPPELADAVAAASRWVLPDALAARLEAEPRAEGSSMLSTKADDGMRQAGAFGDSEEWRFEWERSYTRDAWLDGLPHSVRASIPVFHRGTSCTNCWRIRGRIDAVRGTFTMRYTTTVVTTARTAT